MEGSNEEAKFSNFKRNNPYSNTYNPKWKDHQNFRWSNNQNLGANQGIQQSQQAQIQRKPSQLEETLRNFIQATQSSFAQVNKNHKTTSRKHDASIKFWRCRLVNFLDK